MPNEAPTIVQNNPHQEARVFVTQPNQVLLAHKDYVAHDLQKLIDEHLPHPARARGASAHHTLASLIEHCKRHAGPETVAFCDASQAGAPSITVVYNYNPGAAQREAAGRGGHGDHRAVYKFPLSEGWQRWTKAFAGALSVQQLGELLEDRAEDLREARKDTPELPGVRYATPAMLLDLASGLNVRVEQEVVEHRKADDGSARLVFAEQHKTTDQRGDPVKVPNGFLLGLQVFVDGEHYCVPVRLRYQVRERRIAWTLAPHNVAATLREAIRDAAAQFAKATGAALFFGTAE